MACSNGSDVLLTVWCIGVGGSILAVSCLLLERTARRSLGRSLSGLAVILCAVSCVCASRRPPEVWVPIACLGLVCVLAWAVHYPVIVRSTRRLARPQAIWILMLTASPLYAIYCTHDLNVPGFDLKLFNQFIRSLDEVPDLRLRTDRGREIKPYHYVLSDEAERAEREWIADGKLECQVIRTAEYDAASNCHGWVFTGGSYALQGADVEKILADNGYQITATPQEGDVIIYRDSDGSIVHTGLVKHVVTNGPVLIESKWGPLGRFLHLLEGQPYGKRFTYYRSKRPGHQLQVVGTPGRHSSTAHAKPPAAPAPGA